MEINTGSVAWKIFADAPALFGNDCRKFIRHMRKSDKNRSLHKIPKHKLQNGWRMLLRLALASRSLGELA